VLVAERRGYGRSDGPTWPQAVGRDRGRWIARLQEETDDVLAAAEYLRALPVVDATRLGLMGWSFGGVVTMLAIGRSTAFAAAVNQAGGALTWNDTPPMRTALLDAAGKAASPTLLQVAENDRTTASITAVGEILARRGVPHRVVIYGPFGAQPSTFADTAPGHQLFSARGVGVWERDVLEFLASHLGGGARP
jgi:dienelactone hydrolase